MTDRRDRLRELADRLADRDDVGDAYTAKSFTDRLFVIEVPASESVPEDVIDLLHDHDLYAANEVYSDDERPAVPFAGSEGHDQFRYVDVQSRGELQSYVVD